MSADLIFSKKLRTVPLLWALVPLVIGIVTGTFAPDIPIYIWAGTAVIFGIMAGFMQRTILVCLTILFFGAAVARLHTPQSTLIQGKRIQLELQITDNPVFRGRSGQSSGIVIPSGERLLVGFDTMYRFEVGQRVSFRGYVNPIDTVSTSYSRLMLARGYVGRTYISRYSQPHLTAATSRSLATRLKKLQTDATARLWRLEGDRDALAVAAVMTTGDRASITPEIRRAYSRTGASHLLAVSGLHVGIVFLIINVLLYLLPLRRGGHFVKNIFAVVAIWLYAGLTGLSPSATRAAVMFTGAQAALAFSRTRSAANILCGTALIMLALKPGLVFDISFQLSFIAVAAITLWFKPLYSLVESRWRLLNALWGVLVVGFVASAATLPLVSHTFGVFSPIGVILNPIVITTAHLIVAFSLVWILVPLPFLEPIFRWLVVGPAWLQNTVVEAVANVPAAAVEYTMPLWMVFAIYAALTIFATFRYDGHSK